MAKNYEEFRTHGKKLVDYLCDYMSKISDYPVAPTIDPGYLVPLLAGEMPKQAETYENVMDDFEKKIMPGVLHWNHPSFYAYFGAGNAYPSILGDMLSSGIAAIGFSWASCPALTELEAIMLDWYALALDLPKFFLSKGSDPESEGGGAIQSSASDAIFSCMCAARAKTIKLLKGDNYEIHDSVYLPQLVCYASTEAHSSIEKAAKMNLVKLRVIAPDSRDVMRGEALEKAIEIDVSNGLCPFFVVATLGTTSQVAFDNLIEIGAVCKKYSSWFHVDGAYGGNAFILPEMRHLKEGMEFVDSFEVNPNKLLMTAFDCTAMWVKNLLTFADAFAVDPVYLKHQHQTSVVDLRHFGTPLSRRFRSLKLFFMFRLYGLEGLQNHVRKVIRVGKYFESLVRGDERFEVRNEVLLGLVCFRILHSDAVNQEFLARMNSSAKIHLTPAKVKGKYVIRFVANQENCSEEQVGSAWKTIQEFATEILAEISPQKKRAQRPALRKLDRTHSQRFSFTRNVSQEIYERQPSIQRLLDGATPLVVIDTDDILQSLQNATQRNKDEQEKSKLQLPRTQTNGI